MHANSIAAYEGLDLNKRETEALEALAALGGVATDRQIARAMGSEDPNRARPRVTELLRRDILIEAATVRCQVTGKSVRMVRLK